MLGDDSGNILRKLSVQRELNIQREHFKKDILDQLGYGKSYTEICEAINSIEQNGTIAERLLDAFPGYYGRFICLHFARFLNEPITTREQQSAYRNIIAYLDSVQSLEFSEDVQSFLMENTKHISVQDIRDINKQMEQSINNPEEFLKENKATMEQYMSFKKSPEYKNSPAYRIQALLKEFNSTSGYYETFIPAMKRLSISYEEYCRQMEITNLDV